MIDSVQPLIRRSASDAFHVRLLAYPAHAQIPSHHHARASLELVLDGYQRERVGRRDFECDTHSAMLKGANVEHSNHVGAKPNRGLAVELSAEIEALLCEVPGAPITTRCCADGATRHLVARIGQELAQRQPGASLVIEGLLFELLGTLVRARARDRLGSDPRLGRAIDYLETHYRRRTTLAEVAKQAGMHPSSLAELFRKCRGVSVGEWVRARRLEFASHALRELQTPISHVALQAGFADQSHLTRLFRARFGVTPAEYRRSLS